MYHFKLANEFELYAQEVKNGDRLVIFARGQQRIATPTPLVKMDAGNDMMRVKPTIDLSRGEYVLSPSSSNAAFVFAVQ